MRLRHGFALFVALLVLAMPATGVFAEEEGGSGPAAHGGAGHGDPGETKEERQLIVPHGAEILVAIVTFVLLLIILTKFGWKPILNGLQQREATIQKALDDAQKANADALALLEQYQGRMDEAKNEAQAIADQARKEAEHARQRIELDANERAQETLKRSLREIEQAKESALDEILTEVGNIATEAASRIVRRDLTSDDNAKIVDDVVSDFANAQGGTSA